MNNTIFVVRHGQTDWNFRDIFQGETDIPLNDTGRNQARDTAKTLGEIKFDAIYSSPLVRARETCEIIVNKNKFGGKMIFDDRIRERSFGKLEGTAIEDFMKEFPYGWWNIYHKEILADGMETIDDVMKRVHAFLDEIKVKHKDKNILIVCHGGVMRAIYFYFNQYPEHGDLYRAYFSDNAEVAKYNL